MNSVFFSFDISKLRVSPDPPYFYNIFAFISRFSRKEDKLV